MLRSKAANVSFFILFLHHLIVSQNLKFYAYVNNSQIKIIHPISFLEFRSIYATAFSYTGYRTGT